MWPNYKHILQWYMNIEEYYAVDHTPIRTLEGYESLFPGRVSSTDGDTPEKSYNLIWEIWNGPLYLVDLQFFCFNGWGAPFSESLNQKITERRNEVYPNHEDYRMVEDFIGEKFEPVPSTFRTTIPSKPQGVIKATWVTGTFLLKKHEVGAEKKGLSKPLMRLL